MTPFITFIPIIGYYIKFMHAPEAAMIGKASVKIFVV